jgi:D-sedoheptulose 7-phosphate isomerase
MFFDRKTAQIELDSYNIKLRNAFNSVNQEEIVQILFALIQIRQTGARLFIAGNGGSASTGQHFAVDLGVGGIGRNSIIKSFNLSDNQSAITALANDKDFESVFSSQLSILGQPSDSLLVISASGNSPNLVNAVKEAKNLGMKTLGFLGFDGGSLRQICDQSILVNSEKGEYGIVEDVHLSICHSLTEALRNIS